MGDGNRDVALLSGEQHRVGTFGDDELSVDKFALARAGFYHTKSDGILRCFSCGLEVDASALDPTASVVRLHKERRPDCQFAQTLILAQNGIRTKTFASYDSLRFEKERLETFIEWPVRWLRPSDLARDGFYYLRTADHCACVFCRGIVGAWEEGDSPRGEHQRHFPHCPFIRRQPVGNIPLEQSEILNKMTPRSPKTMKTSMGIDVCGTPRHMPGSYAEKSGPPQIGLVNLEEMGLPRHTGPKRKDFLTYDSRLESFVRWPELVKQKPRELAEAGFFYCGLSDHVRCFHCGNGLRNWESDDQPWTEHARWYPDCSFVILKQGQDFVDKIRREKPPYLRTQVRAKAAGAPSAARISVDEADLDHLMELDIIKAVVAMGFPQDKVRAALCRKLEQTGLPFFSLEPCIESVLQYMEEETRRTLREATAQEIESEAAAQQAAKMLSLQPEDPSATPHPPSAPSTPAPPRPSDASSTSTSTAPQRPSGASSAPVPASAPAAVSPAAQTPAPRPPTPASPVSSTSSASTQPEVMEIDEPATEVQTQPMDVITEADEIMGMAEVALKPQTSGPSPMDKKKGQGQASGEESHEGPSAPKSPRKFSGLVSAQTSKELAEELERIHDIRTCKVCMDAEMDVVFLPCQHMVTCSSCALALSECPICREDIKYSIKPILS